MKKASASMILAVAVAAFAALLLAGCQEGRNHEMRQQPANVDTLVFDEAYLSGCGCLRLWGLGRWSWINEFRVEGLEFRVVGSLELLVGSWSVSLFVL